MEGSYIIAGWKNSTGGYTIVTLKGTGHVLPTTSIIQLHEPTALVGDPKSWAKLSFSFNVPATSMATTISTATNLIWAGGSVVPEHPDSTVTPFQQHDVHGTFSGADMLTSSATPMVQALTVSLALAVLFVL
ncbi:hypothetical protein HDV03_005477 [Kappamyces sp. JEL0829]|nr:hypothetical protein HDV03_005477 [Kappamyces sp. JEL0829]